MLPFLSMSTKAFPLFRKKIVAGVEHRRDPLFGSWTRINPDRARRVKHTGEGSHDRDLQRLIETSRNTCPFCPERRDAETPVFARDLLPSERLERNGHVLFPNKSPFGEYHGVEILTDDHYLPMNAYTEETLQESLLLTQEYLNAVHGKDPSARFPVYVWNFLPPSAGSIVHPHIQVLLESRPAPIIEALTVNCRRWSDEHGEPFWKTLVREEAKRKERMIWEAEDVVVLASFAPRGFNEILLVLPGSGSLADLDPGEIRSFSWALVRLLKAYHAMGVGSFNLVTYSAPLDARPPAFPFHTKLISRPYPSGIYTNDTGFFERMYDLWIIDTLPEEIAQQARSFFAAA
jgi:galactose-1-phosphate uridylyltransferase